MLSFQVILFQKVTASKRRTSIAKILALIPLDVPKLKKFRLHVPFSALLSAFSEAADSPRFGSRVSAGAVFIAPGLFIIEADMVSGAGGDGSTYQRILEILKKSGGGFTVKGLCAELELSSMAVRRQLALLEGRDLIFATKSKKKTGRPEFKYFLTDSGHEAFRREYAEAAIELLVQLRTDDGRDRVNQLFEGRKDAWVQRCRDRISGKTLEVRVHEVTRLLTDEGYMATWEKLGPENYLIREMNCPVAKIARKFPQTCVYEQDFLSELLGAKVTRKHHILQKDHFCSYVIQGPDAR